MAIAGNTAVVASGFRTQMFTYNYSEHYCGKAKVPGWQKATNLGALIPETTVAISSIAMSVDGKTIVAGVRRGFAPDGVYIFDFDSASQQWKAPYLCIPSPMPYGNPKVAVNENGSVVVVGMPEIDTFGKAFALERFATSSSSCADWTNSELAPGMRHPAGYFGNSVAASGDGVVVGEPYLPGSPTLLDGWAYYFQRTSFGSWWPQLQLIPQVRGNPSSGEAIANFGYSVALKGATIAISGMPYASGVYVYNLLLPGDANLDGRFDMADLNTLTDYILGRMPLAKDSPAWINSNVNGDGAVDMQDLNLFVDCGLKRITHFPIQPAGSKYCLDQTGFGAQSR